jgi:hypothetical protein
VENDSRVTFYLESFSIRSIGFESCTTASGESESGVIMAFSMLVMEQY